MRRNTTLGKCFQGETQELIFYGAVKRVIYFSKNVRCWNIYDERSLQFFIFFLVTWETLHIDLTTLFNKIKYIL